ncbi:MAG: hypothetical protein AAF226_17360, partial [Verrucomicrobiota bacterium]
MIRFKPSYKDLFSTEKGGMTFLLLTVCILIPVVGPLVAMGYLIQRFVCKREKGFEPDLNFENFVEYLKIGLWPFLATLVMILIFVIPLIILHGLNMFLIIAGAESENYIFVILGILSYIFIFGGLITLMNLVNAPITLSAGLTMTFSGG